MEGVLGQVYSSSRLLDQEPSLKYPDTSFCIIASLLMVE
jgi:hypothetical protein